VEEAPYGEGSADRPKDSRSTVLSIEGVAIIVAFCPHTLLPLDDCLYALQATIPHLTRSSLHRCLQRHSIFRQPEVEGDKPDKRKFKTNPIGYFHIDIAEVYTEGASCTCSSRSTEPPSSPSPSNTTRPIGRAPHASWRP
jgi:hypothetical protein